MKKTATFGFALLLGFSMVCWAQQHVDSLSAWLMGGHWRHVTVRSGDTILSIFANRHWSKNDAYAMLKLPRAKHHLRRLHPGQQLVVMVRKARIITLHLPVDHQKTLVISQQQGKFFERMRVVDQQTQLKHQNFVIKNSLYGSAKKQQVSARIIANLTQVLQDQIDLNHAVHRGDRVALTIQTPHEKSQGDATLLDAKFCHKRKCYRAIRFTDQQGASGYYTPNGYSVQLAFDRSPLRRYRVSSSFSRHRWHPILRRWRSHLGVDLAAPSGSKIHATSAGRIVFSGRKGGYGRVVVIQHGRRYRTVYAHMSRIARASRTGRRVFRGQVIGYVGQTGIATGPHCHYEFRVHGRAMNPMRVHLPKRHRLSGKNLNKFKQKLAKLDQWMHR